MSQLNVYVPDDLETEIRKRAEKKGESISKYLSHFFKKEILKKKEWQRDFFTKVVGGWQGKLPEIPREPPEERDDL